MFLFFDPTYILVLIGALICLAASLRVKTTYSRYNQMRNSRGITSEEAAQAILQNAGINDVKIERIRGSLTDHYSPAEKVLRLSDSVYGSTSVAAIGVAAHECGHAIQHKVGYGPLKLRSVSVPVANIGSMLSWPLIIFGLILGYTGLARVGIFLFLFVVLFQIITLPVEFNASNRALKVLDERYILQGNELAGAKKVLSAAAMTYVAAVFSSILQLLRLVLLVQGGNRRRR
ncbi:MAG TPA: zinc metallopeptidase [Lachnospiraceae bacterium]|nr:zinc metallopeptidase [Lachnospiraceae bacterium]HPF28667.1 zinc metallopeptidase [Lachnospiraceae bacterium]